MKRIIFILSLVTAVIPSSGHDLNSVLRKLDKVVENRETYAEMTESRIAQLKEQLDKATDPKLQYDYLDKIEEQYRYFCIDSSFSYIDKKKELAISIGEEFYLCAYNLNYAHLYTKSGYFREAQEILDKYNRENIPEMLYEYYLGIRKNFYELQMDYALLPADKEHYRKLIDVNRKERIAYFNDPTTRIDELISAEKYDEAEEIIESLLPEIGNTHSRSIYHYILSRINDRRGEKEERTYNLALAAISDITLGIREYKALSELAIILFSEDDIERADRYLKAAMDDAALCNARPRYQESVDFFTSIDHAYQEKIRKKNTYIVITLIIISIFAMGLTILLRMFYRKNSKLRIARKSLHEAYNNLSEVNKKLKESYKNLEDATIIKDEYIGMYMDQCSSYLAKLDSYRKSLRKMLNVGNMDDLAKAIKSGEFVEQEIKEFYANFDSAFLHLYPSFVEEFNRLLKEDEQVTAESPEKLTAELRIYALIRLGIDDSAKIAQFLRYSISTIYNYRTKMRNRAKDDRNTFDEQVKRIGIS